MSQNNAQTDDMKMDIDQTPDDSKREEMEANSEMSGVPKDALIIDGILREMGAREYDPKVAAQLLEFTHRWANYY